jgi:hypothetical protein
MRGIFFHYQPEFNWRGTAIENSENMAPVVVEIQPDPNYYLDPSLPPEDLKMTYSVLSTEIKNGNTSCRYAYYPKPASYGDILKAIATNPNTPTETLILAAKKYPEAVLSNPVFPFILMRDPTFDAFADNAIEALMNAARGSDTYALLARIHHNRLIVAQYFWPTYEKADEETKRRLRHTLKSSK